MSLYKLLNIISKCVLILSMPIILLFIADGTATQSPGATSTSIEDSQALRASLHLILPSHVVPMSSLETYSRSNLYEVINGQADLYLKAGFAKLTTQRLKLIRDPSKWIEIYIYQMNRLRSAFAVYSGQRRVNAKSLNLTPFAYQAQNAIFFVHDSLYIEIIGSDETGQLISAMQMFAQAFVDQHPAKMKPIKELSLFPISNLIPDSLTLLPKGAFGFDRFKDVFTANYHLDDDHVTAFISSCPNPSEAANLSRVYQEYLMEYGGETVSISIPLHNATMIQIHDMFELIFTHNEYVAGVHQAPTRAAAETLAIQLSVELSANLR